MDRIPGNRFVEDCAYFVTMTLKERRPLFGDAGAADVVFHELQWHRERHGIRLYAYVIMPEHVHVVLRPVAPLALPQWVRRFKTMVARTMNRGPIWLPGYWSEFLWDEKILAEKIEYVHRNPLRRGLVDEAGQFAWSSAGEYERDDGFVLIDDFRNG